MMMCQQHPNTGHAQPFYLGKGSAGEPFHWGVVGGFAFCLPDYCTIRVTDEPFGWLMLAGDPVTMMV